MTGNAVTWPDGCYEPEGGQNARIGFFIVDEGAAGTMAVTPDPRFGIASYTTCSDWPTTPEYQIGVPNLASIDLAQGTTPLCNMCSPTPASSCVASSGVCPILIQWSHPGVNVDGFHVRRDGQTILTVGPDVREALDSNIVLGVHVPVLRRRVQRVRHGASVQLRSRERATHTASHELPGLERSL